jgi:hypothetical protein
VKVELEVMSRLRQYLVGDKFAMFRGTLKISVPVNAFVGLEYKAMAFKESILLD